MIPFIEIFRLVKHIETENKIELPGTGGREKWRLCLMDVKSQ